MPKLVLASRSPRRIEVLKSNGYSFEVVPSDIDEHIDENMTLPEAMQKLAREKGEEVAKRHSSEVILSADTMVVLNGEVIGKPENKAQARAWLKLMSGATHEVITAYCIIHRPSRTIISGADIAKLTFRRLTDDEIEAYVATKEPYDKAGGYNVEETAKDWVEHIDGQKNTILGMPLEKIALALEKLGIMPDHNILAV